MEWFNWERIASSGYVGLFTAILGLLYASRSYLAKWHDVSIQLLHAIRRRMDATTDLRKSEAELNRSVIERRRREEESEQPEPDTTESLPKRSNEAVSPGDVKRSGTRPRDPGHRKQ